MIAISRNDKRWKWHTFRFWYFYWKPPRCIMMCAIFNTYYILYAGSKTTYTANIFNVIFTLFMCVPFSTVIPMYGLHLITAPSTVEKCKHWFTVVYWNIYTSTLPLYIFAVYQYSALMSVRLCNFEDGGS